jgi:uncharacterized protein YdbL (DUF1318 family)
MKTRFVTFLVFAALAAVLACITINIYFPEAQVKKTAEEIVDEVRQKEAKDKSAPETIKKDIPEPRAEAFRLVPAAFAQEETTVSNPAIRALKDSLRQRFPQLKPHFDAGRIGENNTGFVDIRGEGGLDLKGKADLRVLVRDENADRAALYAEVAKALKIDPSQIERIRKIFAESWINAAAPGWWIQKENGDWVKK